MRAGALPAPAETTARRCLHRLFHLGAYTDEQAFAPTCSSNSVTNDRGDGSENAGQIGLASVVH
jgi:hypothetical protein